MVAEGGDFVIVNAEHVWNVYTETLRADLSQQNLIQTTIPTIQLTTAEQVLKVNVIFGRNIKHVTNMLNITFDTFHKLVIEGWIDCISCWTAPSESHSLVPQYNTHFFCTK